MRLFAKYNCVILTVVCLSVSVFATTIYVDDDGPNDPGICDSSVSDPLEDGSETHPFDKIQEAIDVAVSDDVIETAAGIYRENIRVSQKNNITIVGVGSDVTTINGGGNGHVVVFNLADGAISGFTITNSGNSPLYLAGLFTSQCDVLVEECIVKNNNYGIKFSSGSFGSVYRSKVINNSNEGVNYSQSTGFVKNCVIARNQWSGVKLSNSSADIVNNTIVNNGFAGLYCVPIGPMTIYNNIISNHDYAVISLKKDSISYLNISYNNCYANDNNYWYEWSTVCIPEDPDCVPEGESRAFVPIPGVGEMNTNPVFASIVNNDYHLKSEYGRWDVSVEKWIYDEMSSPCIDAGDSSDMSWQSELWPHGKRINMGAYGGTGQSSMSANQVGSIADIDHDGEVGLLDIVLMAKDWLTQQNLLDTDLDRNGIVNMADFAELVNRN